MTLFGIHRVLFTCGIPTMGVLHEVFDDAAKMRSVSASIGQSPGHDRLRRFDAG